MQAVQTIAHTGQRQRGKCQRRQHRPRDDAARRAARGRRAQQHRQPAGVAALRERGEQQQARHHVGQWRRHGGKPRLASVGLPSNRPTSEVRREQAERGENRKQLRAEPRAQRHEKQCQRRRGQHDARGARHSAGRGHWQQASASGMRGPTMLSNHASTAREAVEGNANPKASTASSWPRPRANSARSAHGQRRQRQVDDAQRRQRRHQGQRSRARWRRVITSPDQHTEAATSAAHDSSRDARIAAIERVSDFMRGRGVLQAAQAAWLSVHSYRSRILPVAGPRLLVIEMRDAYSAVSHDGNCCQTLPPCKRHAHLARAGVFQRGSARRPTARRFAVRDAYAHAKNMPPHP